MQAKKIAVWSGPRNVSTALMYSFAQRADTTVLDEPLFGYFLKETGVERPSRNEALASMETNAQAVLQRVHSFTETPVLMMKNMANHLVGLDWSFLHEYCNIILTRAPDEVLTSYVKQIETPTLLDLGYGFQTQLLEYLTQRNLPVLVVDSMLIRQNPEGELRRMCAHAAIEFDSSMLSWPAGSRAEDGVWAKYWYHNVHKSTGFAPYRPKADVVPAHLQPLLEACSAHYELLKPHSINK